MTVACIKQSAKEREGLLYSSLLSFSPFRLVVSSLEALESCFAVGPVNEKASNFLNTFLSF